MRSFLLFSRGLQLLFFSFGFLINAPADDLPPGVPNPIGPNGKYTHAMMFTTKAYQDEALRLVLEEANRVAAELHLPEKLPITQAEVVRPFISPFGYAYAKKSIGNVLTKNYAYYVSKGNKFSYLEGAHQNEDCRNFQKSYLWPLNRVDKNAAFQLATQWLAAVSMDVKALNHDCQATVQLDEAYVHPPAGKFVPVYNVLWTKGPDSGAVASVRVFTPTKTLLQLRVEDPKYILRSPLVFTKLAVLLGQTNASQGVAPSDGPASSRLKSKPPL